MQLEATTEAGAETVRIGVFSYMAASSETSLFRNGKVLTRRDADGSDAEWKGVDLVKREMPVLDARRLTGAEQPTLTHNGFEIVERPLADPGLDFLDHEQVVRSYYPQCEDVIREATGASIVAAFDHNVRSAAGKQSKKRIEGGQQVQGPAHVVHGDYTMTSSIQRMRDLTNPPSSNDTLRSVLGEGRSLLDTEAVERALDSGRFAIINLWRNIASEPVATNPLAMCDAATVRPEDLVVFEIHYADRIGENYFARHSDRHEWYCYPGLTRNEALLLKQWDSEGGMARSKGERPDSPDAGAECTFSFHSAFEDPTTPPDAPDRWSIETRCMVLYD